jgi:hypothetical protein
MPKGMHLPLRVGTRGGARTVEGSEARKQNVFLGVMPASSKHPWHQELTPPEETIFDLADELTGGLLISRIYSFFDEQERLGLTSLPKTRDSLVLDQSNASNGEIGIIINYIDLEDNKSRTVRIGPGRRL